jgi:hypothetical protein
MISYDAETHVARQKEMARRAAESYPQIRHLLAVAPPAQRRAAHRRALAGLGVRLVALGMRLQGELAQLPGPELVDPFGTVHQEPCLEC